MIYDNTTKTDYSVLDLGFDKNLTKNIVGAQGPIPTPELVNVFTSGLAPKNLNSGELISTLEQQVGVLFNGKIAFDNTQTGYRLGIDISDELVKFYIGNTTNYLNWTGTALVIAGSLSASSIDIPDTTIDPTIIQNYSGNRNIPSVNGTSRLSVHLRFGTVSIRQLTKSATELNEQWLNELLILKKNHGPHWD